MRLSFAVSFFFLLTFFAKAQSAESALSVSKRLSDWREAMKNGSWTPSVIIDSCALLLHQQRQDSTKSNILTLQASAFRQKNELEKALMLHQQALVLRENSFGKKSNPAATSLMNIGNCLLEMGKIPEAEAAYRQSLRLKEYCFPNTAHEEKLGIYNAIGFFFRTVNNKKEALYYLQKSLADAEKLYGSHSPKMLPSRRVLADFYFKENRIVEASDQLTKAAETERSLGHKQQLAEILTDLANCYLKTGANERALQLSTESVNLYRLLPNVAPQNYGRAVYNLATSHLELGDFDAAAQFLNEAAAHFETPSVDRADVQLNLGRIEWLKGNANKALDYFAEAVTLYEQTYQPQISETRLAAAYLNLGDLYLFDKKNPMSADAYFGKALKMYETLREKENIAQCLLKLGQSRKEAGQKQAAQKRYSQAYELVKNTANTTVIFNAYFLLGELALETNDWQTALDFYGKARNSLVSVPLSEGQKMASFEYEKLQLTEAISFVLKSKARQTNTKNDWQNALKQAKIVLEGLTNLKTKLRERTSEVVLQHLFFRAFESAIESCFVLNNPQLAFFYAEKSKLSLLKRLFLNKPTEKTLSVDSNDFIFSIANIQKSLLPSQTLVQYHFGSDRLFAFVIKRDTFQTFTLNAQADLSQNITQFYESCSISPALLPDIIKDSAATTFVQLSQKLYTSLIQPFENQLSDEVIIIPDGLLCYLPYEALIRPNNVPNSTAYQFKNHDYLLLHHTVVYDYSSTFWVSLKQLPRQETAQKALTIAPIFAPLSSRNDLSPLEHNIEEAVSITSIIGGDKIVAEKATKKQLLKDINQYKIVHFSTHGILDEAASERSYLAFSTTPKDTTLEESQLTAAEIFNLKIPAEMVVLSACRTAVGRLYRGEGIMSLARSFRYAGARTLVASLWNVDDTQTPNLMAFFYENLKKGLSKSSALTNAKRQYLTTVSHDKAHPFYWAGFLLIGEETALKTNDFTWIWWLLGIILSVFLVFRWLKTRKY